MRRLNCAVQNYAWGKRGSDSKVAQLKTLENEGFETDEDKTYAELWMGTHPNGPSRVMPEAGDFGGADINHAGIFLIELLETHPHYLGDIEEVGDLPFMFKVLSINKALSIQVSGCSDICAVVLLYEGASGGSESPVSPLFLHAK